MGEEREEGAADADEFALGVHDDVDVFVSGGGFFAEADDGFGIEVDVLQFFEEARAVDALSGGGAGEGAAGAVGA